MVAARPDLGSVSRDGAVRVGASAGGRLMRSLMWWASGLGVAAAVGLSTPFFDVRVGPVAPGIPFHVAGPAGRGLLITNIGADPIDVEAKVRMPDRLELKPGARPVPDTGWVQIHPRQLRIAPHQSRSFDVTLHVPHGASSADGFYQVMIWTVTLPNGAARPLTVSGGLLSRICFEVRRP